MGEKAVAGEMAYTYLHKDGFAYLWFKITFKTYI